MSADTTPAESPARPAPAHAAPTGVDGCRLVDFRTYFDGRGGLAFIEGNDGAGDIPFAVKRVYYLWDMGPDSVRGMHAHKALEQVYIAVHGSFDVVLDDGAKTRRVTLDRPDRGLYIGHMVWRELDRFSDGAVCLVLASEFFDADDYYRDKELFLRDAAARGVGR